ncbi:MAG: RHS repeat-associated core domain-containing protein [Verrucomicrobiia bacterium]
MSKFDYAYDSEGEITNWTQQQTFTSSVYNFQYDAAGQLVEALQSGAASSTNEYAYDAAGNRLSERTNTVVEGASYNNVNELTNRSSGGPLRFRGSVNEPISNATVAGNAAIVDSGTNFTGYASVNPGSNTVQVAVSDYNGNTVAHYYSVVLSNGTSQTLTYDLNGNLVNVTNTTTGASTSYAWDAANRLVDIYINGTHQTEFLYDGLGRRVFQGETDNNGDNTISWMLWSGTELCEERDEDGTVVKRYFPQGQWQGGTTYFTRDHLGSIREMMDNISDIDAEYTYDPWGRQTKVGGFMDADFGFTGHYYHAPSGLHLALYRAYNADLGRWLGRDPIEETGGFNLYGYVENEPLAQIDPDGTVIVWIEAVLVVAGFTILVITIIHRINASKGNSGNGLTDALATMPTVVKEVPKGVAQVAYPPTLSGSETVGDLVRGQIQNQIIGKVVDKACP